jgi:preprotein translocase subunit YajC
VCALLPGAFSRYPAPGRGRDLENHALLRALPWKLIPYCAADGFFPSGQKDCALTFIASLAPFALPTGVAGMLPFLLIIVVFYFLLIRPQQKKQRTWQDMLGKLKTGDRVTTTGGMRGVITSIKDDSVQLRIPPDNLRIEVVKSAIASVTQDDSK